GCEARRRRRRAGHWPRGRASPTAERRGSLDSAESRLAQPRLAVAPRASLDSAEPHVVAELRFAAERGAPLDSAELHVVAEPGFVVERRCVRRAHRRLQRRRRPRLPAVSDSAAGWAGQLLRPCGFRHCGRSPAASGREPQKSAASACAAPWLKPRCRRAWQGAAAQGVALAPRATRRAGAGAAAQPSAAPGGGLAWPGARRHAVPARHGGLAPRREEPVPDAAQAPRAGRALRALARRAVLALLLLPYAVAPLRLSPLQRR